MKRAGALPSPHITLQGLDDGDSDHDWDNDNDDNDDDASGALPSSSFLKMKKMSRVDCQEDQLLVDHDMTMMMIVIVGILTTMIMKPMVMTMRIMIKITMSLEGAHHERRASARKATFWLTIRTQHRSTMS